jgi:hypothetical protein
MSGAHGFRGRLLPLTGLTTEALRVRPPWSVRRRRGLPPIRGRGCTEQAGSARISSDAPGASQNTRKGSRAPLALTSSSARRSIAVRDGPVGRDELYVRPVGAVRGAGVGARHRAWALPERAARSAAGDGVGSCRRWQPSRDHVLEVGRHDRLYRLRRRCQHSMAALVKRTGRCAP